MKLRVKQCGLRPKEYNIILSAGVGRYKWYQSMYPVRNVSNEDVGPLKGEVTVIVINSLRQEVQKRVSYSPTLLRMVIGDGL